MKPYFEKMPEFGRPLTDRQLSDSAESVEQIKQVESCCRNSTGE